MEQSVVSIIIPVYNSEDLIEKSVRSALNQTYTNIEVVVVNDGSTDCTLDRVRKMQLRDKRIRIIDQENGGVTAARRSGVKCATGKWICFLDSDDTLPQNAVETYSLLFYRNPDIVVTGYPGTLTKEQYLSGMMSLKVRPELCTKMYKASFLKEYSIDIDRSIVIGEDLLESLVLGLHTEDILTVPELLYNVNDNNPRSVTKVFRRTHNYENSYFLNLKKVFLDHCITEPYYLVLEKSYYWLRINGLKNVVLCGNKVDITSEEWNDIYTYYKHHIDLFSFSESLFFSLSSIQWLYRIVMKIRLLLYKM